MVSPGFNKTFFDVPKPESIRWRSPEPSQWRTSYQFDWNPVNPLANRIASIAVRRSVHAMGPGRWTSPFTKTSSGGEPFLGVVELKGWTALEQPTANAAQNRNQYLTVRKSGGRPNYLQPSGGFQGGKLGITKERAKKPAVPMKFILLFTLWCLLFLLCWPLALLALIVFPIVWLIALPFRLAAVVVEALIATLRAILLFPSRLLGGKRCAERA